MKLDVARGVLLDRLEKLATLIEGYETTLAALKYERLQVLHKLAVGGYRPPAKVDRGPHGDEPVPSS